MYNNKKNITPRIVVFLIILAFVIVVGEIINSASFRRNIKSIKSNYSGGIDRTITIYDYNGNVIKEYTGKFDVAETDGSKVMFDDQNGKRVIIYNAIVINEENLD